MNSTTLPSSISWVRHEIDVRSDKSSNNIIALTLKSSSSSLVLSSVFAMTLRCDSGTQKKRGMEILVYVTQDGFFSREQFITLNRYSATSNSNQSYFNHMIPLRVKTEKERKTRGSHEMWSTRWEASDKARAAAALVIKSEVATWRTLMHE